MKVCNSASRSLYQNRHDDEKYKSCLAILGQELMRKWLQNVVVIVVYVKFTTHAYKTFVVNSRNGVARKK